MKILLVEDEEMLNGITAKYLRAENMIHASTGNKPSITLTHPAMTLS